MPNTLRGGWPRLGELSDCACELVASCRLDNLGACQVTEIAFVGVPALLALAFAVALGVAGFLCGCLGA